MSQGESEGGSWYDDHVTHVTLKEGSAPEWGATMRTRLAAVRGRPGWIGTQLLIPSDGLHQRVIIGTSQTRADWVAWHNDPAFVETHARLDGLEAAPRPEWWHEVLLDVRASELAGSAAWSTRLVTGWRPP